MHIEVIKNNEGWTALAQDWNALLAESHIRVPFLTYEFQRAWWQHKGGGEWPEAELCILTGRNEGGELVGIAPLFLADSKLMLIGSHEIADFLDFIVRPQNQANFTQAVLDHLTSDSAADWERLELYNLLEDSRTIPLLQDAAAEKGLKASSEMLQPSPYIPIPDSLDAYADSLDSKHAHELRRKLRRAARHPVPVALEFVEEEQDLEQGLEDFFRLMTSEADKAAFLTDAMRAQMGAIARAAFAGGWLQLGFLKVGHERAAAYLSFDYENRIWAYNAGFDPKYAQLSPGWLLIAEMMEWCIEQGREAFDFMRGDEEYKYRFGGINRYVHRVVVERSSNQS